MQSGLRDTKSEPHEASTLSREIRQHPLRGLSRACRLFPGLERDFPASSCPVSLCLHASFRASDSHPLCPGPSVSHTFLHRARVGAQPLSVALWPKGRKPRAGRRLRPAGRRAPSAPGRSQGAVSALPCATTFRGPSAPCVLQRAVSALTLVKAWTRPCAFLYLRRAAALPLPLFRPLASDGRFFDRGHFQAVTGLTSHRVYTASGSDLATYLSLRLGFAERRSH